MMKRGFLSLVVATILICFVGAPAARCQERTTLPEFFGFYAVDQGRLVALYEGRDSGSVTKADKELYSIPQTSEVSLRIPEISPSARFILFYSNSGEMIQAMTLHRLPHLRNIIETPDLIARANGAKPQVVGTLNMPLLARITEMEFRILTKPVPNQPQMVELVPSSQLKAGLYVFDYAPTGKDGWLATFAATPASAVEQPFCMDLFLPGGFGGKIAFANSELGQQAAPLLPSYRYQTCDSTSATPNRGGASPVAVGGAGASSSVATPSKCGDYDSCVQGGHKAFRSSNWSEALTDFLKAGNIRPNFGLPWFWAGNTYLVMNLFQDATSAWDKALALRFPLPFTACRERGIQPCELGDLEVGLKTVSFLAAGQKVLDAQLADITILGTTNHKNQGYVNFGLVIEGKKYHFDFIPHAVQCSQLAHVNCPRIGIEQQIKISDYVSQVIPKLASGALKAPPVPTQAGTTSATAVPTTSPSAAPCGQALTLGYSILANGHLYSAKSITSSGGEQIPVFFEEKGAPVRDSVLLQRLALGAWTRENIVASAATRSELAGKPQILSDIIGTSQAIQLYEATQDILARGMAEAIEAAVTRGASLSKAVPNLVWGTVRSQLLRSPRTLFTLTAQTGLKKGLDEYRQLGSMLPPSDSSALDITTLENVKDLYGQAQGLDLPSEALASALMPKSASELTSQALSSVVSELIPGLPSANEAVTLGALLQLQKSLAEAGRGLPALQKYAENLNLVLNLSEANNLKIDKWAKAASQACSNGGADPLL